MFHSNQYNGWVIGRFDNLIDMSPQDSEAASFDPKGYNDFTTKEEAAQFLEKLLLMGAEYFEPRLNVMQETITTEVNAMAEGIWLRVNERLEVVLKSAEEHLHEAFSVVMDLPKPGVRSFVVDFNVLQNSAIKEGAITKTGTKSERKWYTLWCRDHQITYQYQEQVYRIYVSDVVGQLQEQMEIDSDDLWTSLDHYVRNEFRTAINSYFADIVDFLERFKGDLADAKHNKELEGETLERLLNAINKLLDKADLHLSSLQSLEEEFPLLAQDRCRR
jgi:hypothetical protein